MGSQAIEQLGKRLVEGDPAALARAITLVCDAGNVGMAVHRGVRPQVGQAQVVGITGPPGAGKSTLIDALVAAWRSSGQRVAVVAVDPSSSVSGGAVLGDRTRMGRHTQDEGVFIRSISSRGHLGGLSSHIFRVVDLLDAAGWDLIVLETVGAGQSEIEVADVADTTVVVSAPGLGDDVQAIKAGILEVADVLVVNKADSPLASRTERQLRSMLELRPEEARNVPVVATIATEESGIDALVTAIGQHAEQRQVDRRQKMSERTRRLIAQEAAAEVKRWLLADTSAETADVLASVVEGSCDTSEAVARLLSQRYERVAST